MLVSGKDSIDLYDRQGLFTVTLAMILTYNILMKQKGILINAKMNIKLYNQLPHRQKCVSKVCTETEITQK